MKINLQNIEDNERNRGSGLMKVRQQEFGEIKCS